MVRILKRNNPDGTSIATFNHCRGNLLVEAGYNSLENHNRCCHHRTKEDVRQQIFALDTSTTNSKSNVKTYKFDAKLREGCLLKTIMKHDSPFLFIGCKYLFQQFACLCPIYNFL